MQLCHAQIISYVQFIQETCIGRSRGGRRKSPLFPIEIWSLFEQIVEGLPGTNNAVEAWHNLFQAALQCCHSTFWEFFSALLKEQGLQEVNLQHLEGQSIARPVKV